MICPNCGFINPDNAAYCVSCATSLKAGTSQAGTAGPSPYRAQTYSPLAHRASVSGSPLSISSIAMIVAVILLTLSFGLYIYYAEGIMPDSFVDYQALESVMKAMYYSQQVGDIALIIGLLFLVQALIMGQSRVALLALIPQARLRLIKWMLIVAAILLIVGVSTYFSVSELHVDFGYEVFMRLYTYPVRIGWLLAAISLLTFTLSVKEVARSNP